MKKILLYLVLCLWAAPSAFAQNDLLATLSHDGNITTYYGAHALQQAHEAAAHGDVITLSSGTFQSVNLTKAVTLRGAGMEANPNTGALPTILAGSFTINVSDTLSHRLTVEGIFHNGIMTVSGVLKNAMFLKSRFSQVSYGSNSRNILKDVSFIHCKIVKSVNAGTESTVSFLGSYVYGVYASKFGGNGMYTFTNCVVYFNESEPNRCTLANSIVYNKSSNGYIDSGSSMAYNSVAFGGATDFFKYIPNTTNTYVADVKTLFKTYAGGEAKDDETFELTEEAQKKYLGTDGTQIGIHGGSLPFDATPSTPQITKCNVAAKSTADGKLSVDITVKAAE